MQRTELSRDKRSVKHRECKNTGGKNKMKTILGKCKKCRHMVCKVSKERGIVNRLFNGEICHTNGRQKWAVICRVDKCGCMSPEVQK